MNIISRVIVTFLIIFPTTATALDIGGAILEGLRRGINSPPPHPSQKPVKDDLAVIDYKELFPQVSRIELKTIQTRKFKKSADEIFEGIKSLCADKSGVFGGVLPKYQGVENPAVLEKSVDVTGVERARYEKYKRIDFGPLYCMRRTVIGGGEFLISTDPHSKYKYANIKYELDWDPTDTAETTVRMRISWSTTNVPGYGNGSSEQTTAAFFYQANFKELADGLFIDAIQLSPAEIQ